MAGFAKMRAKVTVVRDNTRAFDLAIKTLERDQVLAGIPAAKAARQPENGKAAPANNAMLGYVHNYGYPPKNIPPRPFMEPGIKNVQVKIVQQFQKAGEAAFEGRPELVHKNLVAVGIIAASGIRNKIDTGPFVPLGASTLAARRRRGRTGTKPLIDTSQLRNSISFVVRTKLL